MLFRSIVDMRLKFNLGRADYNALTVVIILNLGGRVVGMVVDSVSDVLMLNEDQIRPAPHMGGALDIEYIMGLGTVDERMLIMVDIDKLMNSETMALLDSPIH